MLTQILTEIKTTFISASKNLIISETILYFIISSVLAYSCYKIFEIIGEKYTKPKPETKKLMQFFLTSGIFFFLSALFEILLIYFSIKTFKTFSLKLNIIALIILLTIFYITSRYHLILSIYEKFKNKKSKIIKNTVKTITIIGIIGDFIIFTSLWALENFLVIYYNIFILALIFLWIIRHNNPNHKKTYSIYFLLLFLIFNRMNYIFIDMGTTNLFLILDIILSLILILAHITIYKLIKNNSTKLLE